MELSEDLMFGLEENLGEPAPVVKEQHEMGRSQSLKQQQQREQQNLQQELSYSQEQGHGQQQQQPYQPPSSPPQRYSSSPHRRSASGSLPPGSPMRPGVGAPVSAEMVREFDRAVSTDPEERATSPLIPLKLDEDPSPAAAAAAAVAATVTAVAPSIGVPSSSGIAAALGRNSSIRDPATEIPANARSQREEENQAAKGSAHLKQFPSSASETHEGSSGSGSGSCSGTKMDSTNPRTINEISMNDGKLSSEDGNPTDLPGQIGRRRRRANPTTDDFELLCVIGMGAFGRVLQVRNKVDQEIYAMKVISKKVLRKKNSVENMRAERDILTKVDHPFVVNLKCSFGTEKKLFLVMEYLHGGELFFHLRKQGLLLEDTARFYVGEILLALEHLHQKGIIHRDLKPENVLMDVDGHAKLTDFGLAKDYFGPTGREWEKREREREERKAREAAAAAAAAAAVTAAEAATTAAEAATTAAEAATTAGVATAGDGGEGNTGAENGQDFSKSGGQVNTLLRVGEPEKMQHQSSAETILSLDELKPTRTLCGTTEYMAPEMLRRTGYGKAVDFWSLGALMYEMMVGKAPFRGRTTKDIEEKILTTKPKFPSFLRAESVAIMKGLMERNVAKRLGATKSTMFTVGGVAGLKDHKFFKGLRWDRLLNKLDLPPIRIELGNEEDTSNFDTEFTGMQIPGSISEPSSPSYSERNGAAGAGSFVGSPDWAGFDWVSESFQYQGGLLGSFDLGSFDQEHHDNPLESFEKQRPAPTSHTSLQQLQQQRQQTQAQQSYGGAYHAGPEARRPSSSDEESDLKNDISTHRTKKGNDGTEGHDSSNKRLGLFAAPGRGRSLESLLQPFEHLDEGDGATETEATRLRPPGNRKFPSSSSSSSSSSTSSLSSSAVVGRLPSQQEVSKEYQPQRQSRSQEIAEPQQSSSKESTSQVSGSTGKKKRQRKNKGKPGGGTGPAGEPKQSQKEAQEENSYAKAEPTEISTSSAVKEQSEVAATVPVSVTVVQEPTAPSGLGQLLRETELASTKQWQSQRRVQPNNPVPPLPPPLPVNQQSPMPSSATGTLPVEDGDIAPAPVLSPLRPPTSWAAAVAASPRRSLRPGGGKGIGFTSQRSTPLYQNSNLSNVNGANASATSGARQTSEISSSESGNIEASSKWKPNAAAREWKPSALAQTFVPSGSGRTGHT